MESFDDWKMYFPQLFSWLEKQGTVTQGQTRVEQDYDSAARGLGFERELILNGNRLGKLYLFDNGETRVYYGKPIPGSLGMQSRLEQINRTNAVSLREIQIEHSTREFEKHVKKGNGWKPIMTTGRADGWNFYYFP